MNASTGLDSTQQRAGGFSALYLAVAYMAALPYFLLVVDYPGATTAAQKVALVTSHYASMYAMYLASYIVFGIALAVLVFALYDRLREHAPALVRAGTAVGLLWSVALITCGMIYTYGMTTIVGLTESAPAQAIPAWQAIETVALGLGGAGGEILGGLWMLLVSWWRCEVVRCRARWRGWAWRSGPWVFSVSCRRFTIRRCCSGSHRSCGSCGWA